jgi:glucose dehydrogenase
VASLEPAWTFATSVNGGHQSPPIVNDAVMFGTTPGSEVVAVDARTRRAVVALRPRPAERFQPDAPDESGRRPVG